ncbi:hypothetical protein F5883DRAFT_474278 [Diaporthe sp. PMI_573]|nr:hypothetical protein F5883DRAFT_474278 [Diaporthaceae sp. PMI_573]
MVKIVIAGGSGNVGQEILDALVARKKHEIVLLSRKDAPTAEHAPGVKWVKTTYNDVAHLAKLLDGAETVLSFIVDPSDPNSTAQKNLIDAAVRAGVKRFAPSEWTTASFEHMPWYSWKAEVRKYLKDLNRDKKVLEYTLFHPGLFTNYMTYPFNSSKHIQLFETPINFYERRAVICDGGEDSIITLTTVQDTAKVVVLAVEYEEEWPVFSGIKGAEITLGQLIALGEKIRGGTFAVEKLKAEDLKAGIVKSSWLPNSSHHSIPPEARDALAGTMFSGFVLAFSAGIINVSDEWNRLLPDYKFTQTEEFLSEAWVAIDAGAKSVHTED